MDRVEGLIERWLKTSIIARGIFDALCEHPYGLTNSEIIQTVYKGAREPEWAESCVQVAVALFNRKAKAFGSCLRIRGNGGPGSIYRVWIVK